MDACATHSCSVTAAPFEGVRKIVRFNRRFYVGAAASLAAVLPAASRAPAPWRILLLSAALPAAFWLVASLAVSWYVYDRSPLYRLDWLDRCLPAAPRAWVNIHAGLDETSRLLAERFPESLGRVLDIFDPSEMTEPSITAARRSAAASGLPSSWRALPLERGSCDAVFLMFAAHELRRHGARVQLFGEVRRALRTGGEAILVEHLRDWRNFAAFGPGFLHFFSRREWLEAAAEAGLEARTQFAVTPFVQVFALRRRP